MLEHVTSVRALHNKDAAPHGLGVISYRSISVIVGPSLGLPQAKLRGAATWLEWLS